MNHSFIIYRLIITLAFAAAVAVPLKAAPLDRSRMFAASFGWPAVVGQLCNISIGMLVLWIICAASVMAAAYGLIVPSRNLTWFLASYFRIGAVVCFLIMPVKFPR